MCHNKYAPQMLYISHICQIIHVHMNNYVNIYASCGPIAMNSVMGKTCIHTFHIIGICPWTNMTPTSHIYVPLHYYCGPHTNPSSWIYKSKRQLAATFNYQAISIYMSEINMALKCHIYATYANNFMCRYNNTMSVYHNATNSVTTSTGMHTFILLACALEQISPTSYT